MKKQLSDEIIKKAIRQVTAKMLRWPRWRWRLELWRCRNGPPLAHRVRLWWWERRLRRKR